MKIKKFTIQNFRNIDFLEAEPNGSHILLLGDNQRGKSSTIEAILSCLGKKDSPLNPVQFGKDSAEIQIEGTDGTQFKVKYNKKGEPTFEIIAPNGLKDNRKSAIQQVVGNDLDFEVEEFVRQSRSADGRRKQIELVKSLLPDEIIDKYHELERLIASCETVRTEAGKNAKMYESVMKQSKVEQFDLDKYSAPLDENSISNELSRAQDINHNINRAAEGIKLHQNRIDEIDAEIQKLMEEKAERETKVNKLDDYLKANKQVDIEPIKLKLSQISTHNTMYQKVKDYIKCSEDFENWENQYNELTQKILNHRTEKKRLISDSNAIPIPDLWFDDEKLYLGNVPIDSDTLSTSQIMHLGVQIMVAKNPKMKIMCIARGESLGSNRLKEIQQLAEKYDYEIIMEQVIRGEEELKLEFYLKGEDISHKK
jgi:predicted ATP-dependent endonuclease of OLD family